MVGNLQSEQRAEAEDLHWQLARIFDIEIKTQLRALERSARIRETRLPSDNRMGGVQTMPDPTGIDIKSQDDEMLTHTTTGSTTDTAGGRKTLTQYKEDTGEPGKLLCPEDMSRLVATPRTVQSGFKPYRSPRPVFFGPLFT